MSNPYDLSNRTNEKKSDVCWFCDGWTGYEIGDPYALYIGDAGPFCERCHDNLLCKKCNGSGKVSLLLDRRGDPDFLTGFPNGQAIECQQCNGEGWKDE